MNTKEAQNEKQNEDDKEHIVVNTRTPSYFEEEPMDKALETGISEATSPKVERNDYCFQSSGAIQWRPKTRASNKLHMNIKRALNPKLKSETIINVDESNSEEETKSTEQGGNFFTNPRKYIRKHQDYSIIFNKRIHG